MELINVHLVTPERHRPGPRPAGEILKVRVRLVIERVFSNLKRQMRMEDHRAKTLTGLIQRIAQRLLALTLGMHLNLLTGRPPRALAAYDGRSTRIKPLGDPLARRGREEQYAGAGRLPRALIDDARDRVNDQPILVQDRDLKPDLAPEATSSWIVAWTSA
jgi:hypothetical protein